MIRSFRPAPVALRSPTVPERGALPGWIAGLPRDVSALLRSARRPGASWREVAARRFLEAHGLTVEVTGFVPRGASVVVANHLSWLDPIVLATLTPSIPIGKAEIEHWPLVGALARGCGTLFVRRGRVSSGVRVLLASRRLLGSGRSVLNFPEGTTTNGDRVLPFRRGLLGLARRMRVPVIPVGLAYEPRWLAWTDDEALVPHYLRLLAGRGGWVRVRIGSPIAAGSRISANQIALEARERVMNLHRNVHEPAVGA